MLRDGRMVREKVKAPPVRFNPGDIRRTQETVARALNVDPVLFRKPDRRWPVAHARMIAMYICRERLRATYPKLASHFGGLDHTSIIYGVRRVRKCPEMRARADAILDQLRADDLAATPASIDAAGSDLQ